VLKNSGYPAGIMHNALPPWYIAHSLAVFMTALTSNAVYFFAAYELHQSVRMRLGMAACAGLVYCLAALFGGILVDRLGQLRVATAAAFACLLVFIFGAAAVFFRNLAALFAFLLLLNFCVGPLWPAIESAITRCPGTMRLSLRMTLYNLSWSTTGFIAACLAGTLARCLSWPGVFLLAATGSALIWIIFLRVPALPSAAAVGSVAGLGTEHGELGRGTVNSPHARKLLHIAWLSNMLAFVAANTVTPFMPTITLALGVKSCALATALASIASLACVGGFLITTVWTGWHYRIRWTMIPFGALVFGAVAMLLSRSLMTFVLTQIIYGAAVAMLYSGSIYYSMHLGAGSATKAGIHEALIGIGAALGPGLVAVAGAPGAIAPKAMALFAVLCTGGGIIIRMACRARR
jgi:MFS family permease